MKMRAATTDCLTLAKMHLADHNPIIADGWPSADWEMSMEEGWQKRWALASAYTTFMGDASSARNIRPACAKRSKKRSLRLISVLFSPEGIRLKTATGLSLPVSAGKNGNGMLTWLNHEFPTISLLGPMARF